MRGAGRQAETDGPRRLPRSVRHDPEIAATPREGLAAPWILAACWAHVRRPHCSRSRNFPSGQAKPRMNATVRNRAGSRSSGFPARSRGRHDRCFAASGQSVHLHPAQTVTDRRLQGVAEFIYDKQVGRGPLAVRSVSDREQETGAAAPVDIIVFEEHCGR